MACVNLDPANFKRRVTLQTVSRLADGQGGYTEAWVDTLTVWASIEPVKAWEHYQAMQLETPVTHKIQMRYNATATSAKRLLYGTRVMDIKSVINLNEDNAFLEIRAVETT